MKYTSIILMILLVFASCKSGEDFYMKALLEENPQSREQLLKESVETGDTPWAMEALMLMDTEDSSWTLRHIRRLIKEEEISEAFLLYSVRKQLLLQKSGPAESLIGRLNLSERKLYQLLLKDEELTAVKLLSLSQEDSWRELLLLKEADYLPLQKVETALLIDYRIALFDKEYGRAALLYESLLERFPDLALNPELLYQAWYGLALQDSWSLTATALSPHAPDEPKLAFALGRIYRNHREFQRAVEFFRMCGPDKRAWWYLLDSALDVGEDEVLRELPLFLSVLEDPAYYNGQLEDILALQLRRRAWPSVENTARVLLSLNEGTVSSRYFWVWARLMEHGYLEEKEISPETLYREISRRSPLGWYGYLSRWILGEPSISLTDLSEKEEITAAATPADRVFIALIQRGMEKEALTYLQERRHEVSLFAQPYISALYHRQENYYALIHSALDSRSLEGFVMDKSTLMNLHPFAYKEEVKSVAREYGHSSWLLHGLIRIESAYDRKIVSYSGAVGLGQLMVATAEEHAGILGIENPDLTDPATNLLISSRYIYWLNLRSYVETLSDMLIAYNGGPGNLRKWKRQWGDLPPDLFCEVIPYRQSRDYVPLVFTAALHYGYLYGDIPPEDLLDLWIPSYRN